VDFRKVIRMTTPFHNRIRPFARRRSGIALALLIATASLSSAQVPIPTPSGEMLMCESAAASRVVEKVRSTVQGVLVESYVKVGDPVAKGQLLGHTELDATKLQLDIAQHTMEAKANVESARNQAEAWKITREETEESVRRRKVEKSRLDWAIAMEGMYRGNFETQLEAENLQQIQYDYWKQQYEKRFFRAPIDGVVSEVMVEVGKPVNYATHLFTIRDEESLSIPVTVPAELAAAAISQKELPVRTRDGKSVSHAHVHSVADDPRNAGGKILKLLVRAADFPTALRAKLIGMKFDVLLPHLASLDDFVE
jgi:multidrug efflux pump subunit AcrA (membrane-fusion protein)